MDKNGPKNLLGYLMDIVIFFKNKFSYQYFGLEFGGML